MKTRIICAIVACIAVEFAASVAFAQAPRRRQAFDQIEGRRPSVSPYLNLLNNQGSGVPNYQTLVKPALDQRQINFQQQGQIQGLQAQQAQLAQQAQQTRIGNPLLRPTGVHATRMNFARRDGRSFYPALTGR